MLTKAIHIHRPHPDPESFETPEYLFVSEHLRTAAEASLPARTPHEAFHNTYGQYPDARRFGAALRERGFKRGQARIDGVKLKTWKGCTLA